jgi:hypothetical protein
MLAINDVTAAEGNADATTLTFTVTKTGATELPSAVAYATANGTAAQPSDYASASGTLTFAAGETSKTITVTVNGDTVFEANETFNVNLSTPSQATIADNQAVGTITNDDAEPTLTIGDVSAAEGNAGTTPFTFTVTKTGATELPSTVAYTTANGSATQPGDYAVKTGTLSFAAGETTKTVTVLVNGDGVYEANETFEVNLSGPTNATIADNQALGTIENDDAAPSFSIGDVSTDEGNTGTTAFTFTVTKTGATNESAGVSFATASLRGERDVPGQPLRPDQRHHRRQPGARHDPERRRVADAGDRRCGQA